MSIPWHPHRYQRAGMQMLVSQGAAGLLYDPGMAKTSTVLGAFQILRKKGLAKRLLVVAPLRTAVSTWPREVAKWEEFNDLELRVLHGPKKDKLLREPHDVSVINYDGLPWLFKTMAGEDWWWDILCADESTKLKHTNTQRFKTIKPHLKKFRRRIILTGTPAPNGLMDLFGQIFTLDLGASLGQWITHYRNTYFDATGYGGYEWRLKPGAEKTIYEKIRPLVHRLNATDYLDLPPLIYNTITIDLPEGARKVYREMEALLVANVNEQAITAANAAAATGKCRQIANGALWKDPVPGEPRQWAPVHDAKCEALSDLVEELGGKPALVAYEFQHDLERLQKLFPGAPHIGGGVTTTQQRETENAWNAGRLPVLFVQPQSAAHGLNLQEVGAAVVFFSIPWDLENVDQLIRRVWRQGQKERVVVHWMVAKDSVDELVVKTLEQKSRTQNDLLDALKEKIVGPKAAA